MTVIRFYEFVQVCSVMGYGLAKIRDGLLSLTYPQQCRLCDALVDSWDDGVVCRRCWDDASITKLFLNQRGCAKCGAFVVGAPGVNISSNRYEEMEHSVEKKRGVDIKCGYCADMPYEHARACGAYAGGIEASLLFLKSHPHICGRLRRYIARVISEDRELLASDLVVPVPLHRMRLKERGFNQAAVIAKAISEDFNIPLDKASLIRIKQTERHRAGVDRIDRERSVKGAFEVKRPRLITGKSVLLIDDIYTTGSTISASARALLEAGAERVNVLTIARALNDSQHSIIKTR